MRRFTRARLVHPLLSDNLLLLDGFHPSLGKRFSLLARKEDPAVIKRKLVQLRHVSGPDGLTAEEEDLVCRELQELREEDESRSGEAPSSQTTAPGRSSASTYVSRSPRYLHDVSSAGDRALAKSPSGSSKFFGGGADEAEYIRRAKRSASNKNLSADLGSGELKTSARRRAGGGGQSAPQSPVDQEAGAGSSFAGGFPTSTSNGSLLSEADSTVEYAPLQDLPSPSVVPPPSFGALMPPLPPPATDRARRRSSLLDSLTPAQMKRVSATLAAVEDAVFGAEKRAYQDGRPTSASSRAHSRALSSDHQMLSIVVEPEGATEFLEPQISSEHPTADETSAFLPKPQRPPELGQAKRVPSSSGYMPGPRPMRNRSISASSNPPQLIASTSALPSAAKLSLQASASSDVGGNRTSFLSVAGSIHPARVPSERDRASHGSHGSEGSLSSSRYHQAYSVADPYQAEPVPLPMGESQATEPPSDIEPSLGSHTSLEPSYHNVVQQSLEYEQSRSLTDGADSSARETSGEQVAPPGLVSSSLQLNREELLESHVAHFADRLPSSFDLNHWTRPIVTSMSSRALHGHQQSHSSMGSFAQQHHQRYQLSLTPSSILRPDSADSAAFLPQSIESARISSRGLSTQPGIRSVGSYSSELSSCGSSFHSHADDDDYLPDPLANVLDDETSGRRLSNTSHLPNGSTPAFADVAGMEKLLLAASGFSRHDLALVQRKLIEFQPSAPGGGGDLGSTTPRPRASDLFASQTSTAEGKSLPHLASSVQHTSYHATESASSQRVDADDSSSPSVSGHSSAPASHRTQRSRASSILDPELSNSTNAAAQLRSANTDSRPISREDLAQAPQPANQLGLGKPPKPAQTPNSKSRSATAPALSSPACGEGSQPTSSPPSPMVERDPGFEDDFRARVLPYLSPRYVPSSR